MLKLLIISYIVLQIHTSNAAPMWSKYQHYLELQSVDLFREYIRIDTSKEENIRDALDFWVRQVTELGIPYAIYEPAGKPIFVATIEGSDPSLPSIMLNSHVDVVQVDASEWKYPPFDAYMDVNGDIYGRGTQDTKDVAIQYLEAIRRLKKDNITLSRTIHMTLMPDEETGGKGGMRPFAKTQEFKSLNIGFALDEGLTSSDDTMFATYVDRRPWQMQFVIYGEGGHGLKMPDGSTMEKTNLFINAVMAYRDKQKQIQKTKNKTDFSGFTSININIINGGLAANIIPTKMSLTMDMRLPPEATVAETDSLIQSWMDVAGNSTEVHYIRRVTESGATPVDDSNPYWVTMRNTLNNLGIKVAPIVCPATSDMLVVRNLGIPAIGFSTKVRTIPRPHDKDEYQNVETFLKGIDVYTELIKNLANVPSDQAITTHNPLVT